MLRETDRARRHRRQAAAALDDLLAWLYPEPLQRHSERFERTCANDLARQGFDPDYLARRFGLTKRGVLGD